MPMLYYALGVAEVALMVVALCAGLVVAALVGRETEAFAGDCPLGGQVIWTSLINFELSANEGTRCWYISYINAVGAALGFVLGLYRLITLCCGRFDFAILRIVRIPLYSAMAIMTMSAAAVLSHGLNAFCDGLRSQQIQTTNYDCELFQQVDWHIYDGSGFYEDFIKAEASGWVSFLAWASLTAVAVLSCIAERPQSGFPLPNNAK